MNNQPIIIVSGEPNSVFLEIFFKSLKIANCKSPIIIITSKNLLTQQMQKLNFRREVNLIDKNFNNFKKLNNKKINLINVDYNFKNCFEQISSKSNIFIEKSFEIALQILKKNKFSKLINGPISKKYFLKGKSLGITEYLAKKTKKDNSIAMLIYNKKLSISPITTHIALKDVHRKITKKKNLHSS